MGERPKHEDSPARDEGADAADDDGAELFRRAVAGAVPLPDGPARIPRPSAARAARGPAEVEHGSRSSPSSPDESGETLEGWASGVDLKTRRRLRRGEFAVEGSVDLHGRDAPTARAVLVRFLEGARRQRRRCVLVVHGKGLRSPGGEPILKRELPHWLREPPLADWVLAFCSALPRDGGTGAVYVLLRRCP